MIDKKKVLLLSANPANPDPQTGYLQVEKEFREIEECLQKANLRDRFEIVKKGSVRIDDLQPILIQEVPRVVHFSGHGTLNGLILENDTTAWELAPTEALAELFRILQNGIDCVVLNACFSQVQAEAIARYVPYVLGMHIEIGDQAAIEFAKGFYGALFEGKSVKDAFQLGKNRIAFRNMTQAQIPVLLESSDLSTSKILLSTQNYLEEPEGTVRIGSEFYIKRSPQEEQGYKAISRPHALLRLKSPDCMGKSSLLVRVLEEARRLGNRTTWIDLQKCDRRFFENMDRFLQWFCAVIGRDLGVKAKPSDDWDEIYGANSNCEEFFAEYLLVDDRPLVIAIDNLERIFDHEAIEGDFCGLLRGWHEQGKHDKTWAKLRLVLAYSMESYSPKDINMSPFNVGTEIALEEFTSAQLIELAERHGLTEMQLQPIANLLGGHPYLVRMALYHLASGTISFDELMRTATSDAGLFRGHLSRLLARLEQDENLKEILRSLVSSDQPIRFDLATTAKLDGMGVILRTDNGVKIRNQLYRRYFRDRL